MRAELFHVDGLTDATKLMVTYCNFTNPPRNVLLIEDSGTVSKIFNPNTDFIQPFFSLHLMFPFSFLSSSDHVSLNLYAITGIVLLSGTVICRHLHWHVLTSVVLSFFTYHQILYMSLFNMYGIPTKEIPCLLCRSVTAMGDVTWVLGHPHGSATTP